MQTIFEKVTPPVVLPFKVIVSDVEAVSNPTTLSEESSINNAPPIITSVALATCTTKSPVLVIELKISNFAPTLLKLFKSAPGPAIAESELALVAGNVYVTAPAASLCTILPA